MQRTRGILFAGLGVVGCICLILGLGFKIFPIVFILIAAAMFVGVVIIGISILLSGKRDSRSL